jgi:hypothetical protein
MDIMLFKVSALYFRNIIYIDKGIFINFNLETMKELIHEIDENAFVNVYDVAEVQGGNFKKHVHISCISICGEVFIFFNNQLCIKYLS